MKYVLTVLQGASGAGGAVRHVGDFDRLDQAVAAAKEVVDEVLGRAYENGMTATQLVDKYRALGELPYISRDDEETMNAGAFNHFQYAISRSDVMCGGAG
jgi:hypothetical protein